MEATLTAISRSFVSPWLELLSSKRDSLSELFWIGLCLMLFIILGPFSAPIVLGYIIFNEELRGSGNEPESL